MRKYQVVIEMILLIVVFGMAYKPKYANKAMNTGDSFWYIPTALSILREGNVELSEFREEANRISQYKGSIRNFDTDPRLFIQEGDYYNNYPLSVSVMISPLVWGLNHHFSGVSNDLERSLEMGHYLAKLFAALSVGLFFLITLTVFSSRPWAYLLTFIFALCSPHAVQHSGGLWSHNVSLFFILMSTWCFLIKIRGMMFLSAIFGFIAVTMRPDAISYVGALGLFVLIKDRTKLLESLLGGGLAVSIYVFFNIMIFDHFMQPYPTAPGKLGSVFFEALGGLLISPNRGLLIFFPLAVFSLVGALFCWRSSSDKLLQGWYCISAMTILFHLCINSLWTIWWGGWSYGPRLLTTVIPFWIWLIPMGVSVLAKGGNLRKVLVLSLFICTLSFSGFVTWKGLSDFAVYEWNWKPVDVNLEQERLWDWSDMQLFRESGTKK